jgi:Disulphide bond corrector protein DsbC
MRIPRFALLTSSLLVASLALAAEVDPTTLYKITTDGTSAKVAPGKKGTLVLEIQSLKGAHVSDEAPLRIQLSGTGAVTPEKAQLLYGDSVRKPSGSVKYPDPRFEVPLATQGKGPGTVEAKMVFFVCTEQLCLRQQKTLSVPVTVE